MLVLRRKAGEAIVLNGVITIHVLAVEGERVKLGISAPPEVVIVRSELLENQAGTSGGPSASGGYWTNRETRSSTHRGRGAPHPDEPHEDLPDSRPQDASSSSAADRRQEQDDAPLTQARLSSGYLHED